MEFISFYFQHFNHFLIYWWWLFAPFFLYPVLWGMFTYDTYAKYFIRNRMAVMKIKVPKEETRSPLLMENVLHGLWSLIGEPRSRMDVFVFGKLDTFFSLEIASVEGDVFFAVWVWADKVNAFKDQIYAQYPNAEVEVLDRDYMDYVPENVVDDENWSLWGSRMTLFNADAYPIKTYRDFEDSVTGTMVDPMASYLEFLSSLGPGEFGVFQLILRPVGPDEWQADFDNEVERILDRGKYKEKFKIMEHLRKHFSTLPQDTLWAAFKPPEPKEPEDSSDDPLKAALMFKLSPGEQDSIRKIEQSHSKVAFRAQYAWLYVAKKGYFRDAAVNNMFGVINQFNSPGGTGNGFIPNTPYMTSTKYWMEKSRLRFIERRLVRIIKKRQYHDRFYYLNSEEVASLWHFPDTTVQAPKAPWVETKKSSAPNDLPLGKQDF
jgi:hypothetical protein